MYHYPEKSERLAFMNASLATISYQLNTTLWQQSLGDGG
jgi:hypothetical protein